jgi:hypothetical protein
MSEDITQTATVEPATPTAGLDPVGGSESAGGSDAAGGADAAGAAPTAGKAAAADVEEAMKDVVDPELGINVVDLGLVYGCTSTTTTSPRST